MDNSTLAIALVLGLVGAVTGTLGLWAWRLSRHEAQGGAGPGSGAGDEWRRLTQDIASLGQALAELRRQLLEVTEGAIQRIDVDYGRLPGQVVSSSALVALRDASGRDGLILNVYGNPQIRVLLLRNGELRTPDGQVLDMESKFLRRLLSQSRSREVGDG